VLARNLPHLLRQLVWVEQARTQLRQACQGLWWRLLRLGLATRGCCWLRVRAYCCRWLALGCCLALGCLSTASGTLLLLLL
jgi:hypothetical protein